MVLVARSKEPTTLLAAQQGMKKKLSSKEEQGIEELEVIKISMLKSWLGKAVVVTLILFLQVYTFIYVLDVYLNPQSKLLHV